LVADCDESVAINVVARDGYAMTLSYDQLAEGEFTTFNPGTGEEVEREGDLDVIVAYERAGEPIPEDEDGPLRLAIINDENNQVTDGHWSVKWVEQVVIKPAVAEWTLYLEGAITEVMDRNTFESGAAPNCHLGEWTDDEGHVWAGIPFYYMLGRVDDDNAHEGGAYNDELAQAGYTVDVIAADGYTVSLDSTRLHRNRDVILAYLMDGEPLPEKHFPLRLVGDDLAGNERVSAVAQIVLDIPPAGEQEAGSEPAATTEPQETEAEETAPAAPERAAPEMALGTLHIYGAVGEPIAFDRAHLEQIGIETYTVEHPKKGAIEVQGVLLNEVLAETAPVAEATSIVFTASDGYSAESDLAPVLACDTCLIEVEGDTYNLVMPDLQTNYWVKDVRLIELKR
jgi:DMSO/TMAO reductase YedYZ molybdopterin-dependent catalytic subunit